MSCVRTSPELSEIRGRTLFKIVFVPTGLIGGSDDSCVVRLAKASRRCLSDFDEVNDKLCLNAWMTSGAAVDSDCWATWIAGNVLA